MWRWGHTSEFPFGIYGWTLKTWKIRILKNETKKIKNKKIKCWRYYHFTHVHQKPQSYKVQFLRYRIRQNFFVILGHFLSFHLHTPNNPENQNFEKMKKASGDVIILNMCSKNDNHMMHASCDMKCDRHNFFSLWTIFCPLTH